MIEEKINTGSKRARMAAYQFWYKVCPEARTDYVWVIAVSLKQAQFFASRAGVFDNYDFDRSPCWIKPFDAWLDKGHEVGQVLGDRVLL